MRIRFCGVRGSTPAPGGEFVRVGGNTSCVAILAGGDSTPSLVLDAGTGLRAVTRLLDGAAFRGTIVLTHLHWDHWQGLPFFSAGDRDDARVRVIGPAQGEALVDVLRLSMAPPLFPIGPEGLKGAWTFESVDEGAFDVEGFNVSAGEVPHKGGRTFGLRIERDGRTMAYLPDHRPAPSGHARVAALQLAQGVDVLVHDAQFLEHERNVADEYGHSTVPDAVRFAQEAGVGELVLFHHAPNRSDDALDKLVRHVDTDGLRVTLAIEGVERTV